MITKKSALLLSVAFSLFGAANSFADDHAPTAAAKPAAKAAAKKPAAKPVVSATPEPIPVIKLGKESAMEASDDDSVQMDAGNQDDADSADNVDQPLRRAVIESAPAPGSASESVAPPAASAEVAAPAVAAPAAPAPVITAAPVRTESSPSKFVNPISAEQSLKWLINGNTRFTHKNFRADGRLAQDRLNAAKLQKPHAVILSCSESVAPPEIIFDQGIGEITTVRVAGPSLDAAVIKSLEQAVEKYDSHLLIVLGHTQCSAIDDSPYAKNDGKNPSRNLEVEAALNADGIARALTERSAILKTRVEAGQLTIKSGLYWIDSGRVKFY